MIDSTVIPSASALKVGTIRCRRTGCARALTSSTFARNARLEVPLLWIPK